VIIAISRDGLYGPDAPAAALEHLETYLRGVFAFLGVANPEFIIAEGLQLSAERREKSMQGAPGVARTLHAA
jgi:FMN-dependent NADH-azoreductase